MKFDDKMIKSHVCVEFPFIIFLHQETFMKLEAPRVILELKDTCVHAK